MNNSVTEYILFVLLTLLFHPLLWATENDNAAENGNPTVMPNCLTFMPYVLQYGPDGRPLGGNLEPNIHTDIPSCLHAVPIVDRYGNPKIYAGCTGTEVYNPRGYPPLYPGDVFPVLDQLYYFESIHKAIKVSSVEGYPHENHTRVSTRTNEQIILPLAPPDNLPSHPLQIYCRSSGLLHNNFGTVSLVQINGDAKDNSSLSALIYTDCIMGGNLDYSRLGNNIESFQTKKIYRVGDILTSRYLPNNKNRRNVSPTTGFRLTKIVSPDPERNRVFMTAEGEKKGRLIGWVELDPTPIPIDENGNPIEQKE